MNKAEKIHNNEIGTTGKPSDDDINTFRKALLAWYDRHRRTLPWRALPDQKPDPYHVWLSEIMLQQTVVAAVIPYFLKFTEKWPTVHDLAAADNDDVMAAWAGLGYYARARNLHKCAKVVSAELGGVFPEEEKVLQKLPGIGEYTSAAIRAIAFEKPATVVDGNVERVISRFYAVSKPLPDSKKKLKEFAAYLSEGRDNRPGDFAQAMMDLGATICTPKSPKCMLCPLHGLCDGHKQGMAAELPRKRPKKKKQQKSGFIYWIENENGEVLLQKRPENGLLGGMAAFPTSEWGATLPDRFSIDGFASIQLKKPALQKHISVRHSFTHFDLRLDCVEASLAAKEVTGNNALFWIDKNAVEEAGLPTVFKKLLYLRQEAV